MYCKVKGCRYPNFHTTKGHQCGRCKRFGHGVLECNYIDKILNLTNHHKDILPIDKWCKVKDCKYKYFHTTEGHICKYCNTIHTDDDCNVFDLEDSNKRYGSCYNIDDIKKEFLHKDNVFKTVQLGMGHQIFITKRNGIFKCIYMDPHDWGQYNAEFSIKSRKIFDKLIEDLNEIDGDGYQFTVECPICRTSNNNTEIEKIVGLEETCKVCYDKKIDTIFMKCHHACICNTCLDMIKN